MPDLTDREIDDLRAKAMKGVGIVFITAGLTAQAVLDEGGSVEDVPLHAATADDPVLGIATAALCHLAYVTGINPEDLITMGAELAPDFDTERETP